MKKNIQRFGVRTACAVAAMIFAAQAAWALEPFKVQDIRVEGLQRVEPGTIFASMPMRVGDEYNDEKGAAAIRALFALGLFKDVRLEANGNVLVVVVQERPTIADVDFAGAREFDRGGAAAHRQRAGVVDKIAQRQHAVAAAGAPHQCFQARAQFQQIEGLGQVIVTAGLEAVELVFQGVARGEHENRRAA